MSRPDTIMIIDGRGYHWRGIVDVRRQQIAAWKAARPEQPAMFPLRNDSRLSQSVAPQGAIRSRVY